MQEEEGNQWIYNQGHSKHTANQNYQKTTIIYENLQTVLRYSRENQAHNTKRCQLNNPENSLGYNSSQICYHITGSLGSQLFEAKTKDNGPAENTEIITVHQSIYRVGHHISNNGGKNLPNTIWSCICSRIGQLHSNREQLTGQNRSHRSKKGAKNINHNYIFEAAANITGSIGQGTNNQNKYQYRGNTFQ